MHVHLELGFHDLEAVVEGDVEGSPHLFRHVPEGPLARLDLLVEHLALVGTAPVVIEEDVTRVLHEDGAIEVLTVGIGVRKG